MRTGTILLFLVLVAIVAACARTNLNSQDDKNAAGNMENENQTAGNVSLVIEDQSMQQEFESDPLDETVGILDDMPVDESIPQ